MELEITWGRVVRIWWSWLWRASIAVLLVFPVVGIIAFILYFLGFSKPVALIVCPLLAFLLGMVTGIIPFKLILGKNFGDFRLVLLSTNQPPKEMTWDPVWRVWWAYSWRYLIAMIIILILSMIVSGIIGFVLGSLGCSDLVIQIVNFPISLLLGLSTSIAPFRLILGKTFCFPRASLQCEKTFLMNQGNDNSSCFMLERSPCSIPSRQISEY